MPASSGSSDGSTYFLSPQIRRLRHSLSRPALNKSSIICRCWALSFTVSTVWNGVYVRAGTPRAIVDRLNREIVAVLQGPAMRQSLEEQGYDVIPSSPEQFGALGQSETPRWGAVVKQSGATLD